MSDEERQRMWEDWLHNALTEPHPAFDAAERAFFRELPTLLDTMGNGKWVAYTEEGMVAKGNGKLAVHQKIQKLGLRHGTYTIRRIDEELLHPRETELGWDA